MWVFIFLPTLAKIPWRIKSFRGALLHGDLSALRPWGIVILLPPGAAISTADPALTAIFPVGRVNPPEGGKNRSDTRLCQCWSCLKHRMWLCVSYHSQDCRLSQPILLFITAVRKQGWLVLSLCTSPKTCMVILLQINQRIGEKKVEQYQLKSSAKLFGDLFFLEQITDFLTNVSDDLAKSWLGVGCEISLSWFLGGLFLPVLSHLCLVLLSD